MDSKKLDNNIPVSEETQNIKYDYFVAIKLNESAKAYYFSTNFDDLKPGDNVVIETVRGLES